MSEKIKWLCGDMVDSPALAATPGGANLFFTKCLVTGFNNTNIDALTVSAGVATVFTSQPHGFFNKSIVLISGSTTAGLNGEQKIFDVTRTSYKFLAPQAPDGVAIGSMTHKQAPLGWVEHLNFGNNFTSFKSALIEESPILVCDDSNSGVIYLTGAHGIDNKKILYKQFPSKQNGAIMRLYKSNQTRWYIVGNSVTFYLFYVHGYDNQNWAYSSVLGFGKYKTLDRTQSKFASFIVAHQNTSDFSTSEPEPCLTRLSNTNTKPIYTAISYDNKVGYNENIFIDGPTRWNHLRYSGEDVCPSYSAYSNEPLVSNMYIGNNNCIRGIMPGINFICTNFTGSYSGDMYQFQNVFNGRNIMALKAKGTIFVDIDGPWEY